MEKEIAEFYNRMVHHAFSSYPACCMGRDSHVVQPEQFPDIAPLKALKIFKKLY
jgi:hypothetical protein